MQDSPIPAAGSRFVSMILDHFIMTIVAVSFSATGLIFSSSNSFEINHEQPDFNFFNHNTFYFIVIGFALYLCKDSFDGRSPAKRIMKTQIVNNADNLPAGPIKCLVRNIFCILWPIEVIVILFSPGRRIGDLVAGTKVISYDPKSVFKPNFKTIGMSFAFACMVIFAFSIPFIALMSSETKAVPFLKESLNDRESSSMDKKLSENLKLVSDTRIYDKIEDENLKFISIIINVDPDILDNEDNFSLLKERFESILYTEYAAKTFVGQAKFVHKTENSSSQRIVNYDWRKSE